MAAKPSATRSSNTTKLTASGPQGPLPVAPGRDIRHASRHREQGRYESYRRPIHALVQHGGIQPGPDEHTAADLLFALLSPELHDILCITGGWPANDFKTWVTASLEAQFLRPNSPSGGRKTAGCGTLPDDGRYGAARGALQPAQSQRLLIPADQPGNMRMVRTRFGSLRVGEFLALLDSPLRVQC